MNNLETSSTEETSQQLLTLVNQLVKEVHPSTYQHLDISIDSSFDRELGLDSLTRVELLSRVEKKFSVSLPERVLATVETARDLLRAIQAAGPVATIESKAGPAALQTGEKGLAAPTAAATLVQVLQHHAEKHPERTHIRLYSDEGEGETISYGELLAEASLLAAGLQASGLAVGEAVLIMLPTGRDYFISFFGVLLAGGVPVPVYPPGRLKQIEEHLQRHAAIAANSLAKIMITMPEATAFTRLMHTKVASLNKIATVAEILALGSGHPLHLPALSGSNTAFLQYTSGSTGMPKGVVLSNANLLANIRAMGRVLEVSSEDVFISWLPLYHDMGLIGAWLGSLYYACPLVIMSPLTFLARPVRWLKAISRYGGTLAAAPNFAYELCYRRIDEEELRGIDLSSWRGAFNGAEAVSPTSMQGFTDRFAPYGFRPESKMPVYGLAESSVGLAFPPLGRGPRIDHLDRQVLMKEGKAEPVSSATPEALSLPGCGMPLPGHQIRIVDGNNRELPERRQGLIQFQGPSTTSGYFRNPEQSKELFNGPWLDSGDLGYLANGELFITGRSKDMIIKAGRNIYPVELEEAVSGIEGIRKGNVAIFGCTDRQSGTEKMVVLAETRKRKQEDQEKLRIAINTVVNDLTGTAPDEIVLAPPNTVLKTSSGKIRRRANRELYEKGTIGKPLRSVRLQITWFALSSFWSRLRLVFRQLGALTYAGYSWLLFCLAAPLSCLGVALLPTVNSRWQFNQILIRLVFRLAGMQIKIAGVENIPARTTPCILIANHASYLDNIILAGALPRPFGFVAKAELRDNLLLRFLLPRLGTQFVERFDKEKGVADSQKLVALTRSGQSLIFFPEGTFMRMPGLLPFRLGAFETASKANLPVIPLAIRGSRSILRADSWFPRRGMIRVVIGEQLETAEILRRSGGDRWQAAIELRNRARCWILAHCGEPDLEHELPPLLFTKKSRQ